MRSRGRTTIAATCGATARTSPMLACDFIHSRKADDHRGGADNYSWQELLDLAKEYIENGGR